MGQSPEAGRGSVTTGIADPSPRDSVALGGALEFAFLTPFEMMLV